MKKLLLALLCLVGIVSTQASSCNAPAGLTASSITKTSATLSWTPGDAGDTQWLVIYGPAAGSEDEISRTVTTNPYTLTGLNPGTDYNVWVKTDCGGEYSFAAYQSFRTNDKTVITACALQGYDGSSIKVGTTYTYQFGQTIARAITPINAAAPYTTSLSGGSLFKKDDEGRFMQVADNTVLEAGEYIFVIMLHIIQPEATDYRFPRTDEGITVDVTVDGVTWSANPRNYQDGGQTGSSIMCGCPAFVLSNDDPAEIEAAKEELESLSLYSRYLMNEVTDPALLAKLSQVKSTANTVLGNPNATLAELNDAITTCNQILEESGSTYFEAYRDMLIADVHDNVDMTYPSLTQACQALIDQFFSDMEALTYNSSLSFLENMEYLVDQYEQNIGTVEGAMLSGDCGSSEGEIEAAKSELEDYIDYLEAALYAVEDQTLVVQLIQAKTNAQTVYDNPNATLQEINEAIESCNQVLTAAGPTVIEQSIAMYIIQFRAQLATYGELSEACQAAADDYITKLEALAYIPTLSYVENLEYIEMKMLQYTKLLEEQFEANGCEPSEEALDQVPSDQVPSIKVLRDGQLLILVGDKTYDATGAEVK